MKYEPKTLPVQREGVTKFFPDSARRIRAIGVAAKAAKRNNPATE